MVDRFNTLIVDLFSRVELRREAGQGMVEYALILAVVAIAAVGVLATLGTNIGAKFTSISSQL